MTSLNLDIMAEHLLLAAQFADSDEEQDLHPNMLSSSKDSAKRYCEEFVALAEKDLEALAQYPQYWAHPDCRGYMEAAVGHDLWLTAGGHGAGFWDRTTIPDELGESLSKHAVALKRMADNLTQEGSNMWLDWVDAPGMRQG